MCVHDERNRLSRKAERERERIKSCMNSSCVEFMAKDKKRRKKKSRRYWKFSFQQPKRRTQKHKSHTMCLKAKQVFCDVTGINLTRV